MVASIFPIYVYAEKWNLIGTRTILVVLYTAMNLPLAVWMTRSFFMEVPKELIEAADLDQTLRRTVVDRADDLGRRPLLSLLPLALSRRGRRDRSPGDR